MPKVDVYNMQGKKVSDVELSEAVFGICLLYTSPSPRD